MCFEKQHITWLLETHVAFRGGYVKEDAGQNFCNYRIQSPAP